MWCEGSENKANIWHWVWLEAGLPPAGVPADLLNLVTNNYEVNQETEEKGTIH